MRLWELHASAGSTQIRRTAVLTLKLIKIIQQLKPTIVRLYSLKMQNWANGIEHMTNANKEIRALIKQGADEVGQLEQFEERFRVARERFFQFKEMVLKNDRQAEELITQLNQSLLEHRQTAENSKRQIVCLRKSIEQQKAENQKLESDLEDHIVKFQKLRSGWKSVSLNADQQTNPILGDKDTRMLQSLDHH